MLGGGGGKVAPTAASRLSFPDLAEGLVTQTTEVRQAKELSLVLRQANKSVMEDTDLVETSAPHFPKLGLPPEAP